MADLLQPLPVFLSSALPKPSLNSSPGLEVGHIQQALAGVMGSGALLCVSSARLLLPQWGGIRCVSSENPALAEPWEAEWPGGMGAVLHLAPLGFAFPWGSDTLATPSVCVPWDLPQLCSQQ